MESRVTENAASEASTEFEISPDHTTSWKSACAKVKRTRKTKDDKEHFVAEEEVKQDPAPEEDQETAASAGEENATNRHTYDVFISYSSVDQPWVRDVLIKVLEETGLKVCVDYRDFVPGAAIMENITRAITESKVTILVLTPNYVESKWCHYETRYAIGMSLSSCEGRVLPLILMPCDIPPILKHLTYLDYTSEDIQPRFREKLLESLNDADTWRKSVTDFRIEDLVTVSEVEDVVMRRIECQDQIKAKKEKIAEQLKFCQGLAYYCLVAPIILATIVFLLFIFLSISSYSGQNTRIKQEIYLNSSALTVAVDYNSFSFWCKSLHVQDSHQVNLYDFYAFSHKNDAESLITTTLNERFVLRGSQNYKTIILPHDKNMNFSLHFCIHSVDSSSVVSMYELSASDYESFSEAWPNDWYGERSPKKFRANSCNDLMILFDHYTEGNTFVVFAYKGEGNVSVEAKSSLRSTKFDTSKASTHCKNTSYCTIPGLPLTDFVVLTKALTDSVGFSGDPGSIEVICSSGGILPYATVVGFLVLILFALYCIIKKCYPCITKKVLQKHKVQGYEWYVENAEVKYRRVANEQV